MPPLPASLSDRNHQTLTFTFFKKNHSLKFFIFFGLKSLFDKLSFFSKQFVSAVFRLFVWFLLYSLSVLVLFCEVYFYFVKKGNLLGKKSLHSPISRCQCQMFIELVPLLCLLGKLSLTSNPFINEYKGYYSFLLLLEICSKIT